MLDVSVAYNRFRFLGQEFLTWLWFGIATDRYKHLLESDSDADAGAVLSIGDRMVLENRHTNDIEMITIKGDQADLKEGMVALSKGALVAELGVIYQRDGHSWQFTLKGENLGLTNVKTPSTGPTVTDEDMEGALLEKIYLYETVFNLTHLLYKTFIKERTSNDWDKQIRGDILEWITPRDQKN